MVTEMTDLRSFVLITIPWGRALAVEPLHGAYGSGLTVIVVVAACGRVTSMSGPDGREASDAPSDTLSVPGATRADARASCQAILTAEVPDYVRKRQ